MKPVRQSSLKGGRLGRLKAYYLHHEEVKGRGYIRGTQVSHFTRTCKVCGEDFEVYRYNKAVAKVWFCCLEHAHQWYYAHPEVKA